MDIGQFQKMEKLKTGKKYSNMNKIKKMRQEKSLTQEELARVSGIKISTLQKLEKADANLEKMQLGTALKLAKGLKIQIENLLEE